MLHDELPCHIGQFLKEITENVTTPKCLWYRQNTLTIMRMLLWKGTAYISDIQKFYYVFLKNALTSFDQLFNIQNSQQQNTADARFVKFVENT
jgi:hypothetical protein